MSVDLHIDPIGVLLTAAEVGIAMAGFSSLFTLLIDRSRSPATQIQLYRFRGILANGLLVVLFSFFPFIPLSLGVPEVWTWRLGCMLLATVMGYRFYLITKGTAKLAKRGAPLSFLRYPATVVMLITILTPTISVLFRLDGILLGAYLIGVFGILTLSCILFWVVFTALLSDLGDP